MITYCCMLFATDPLYFSHDCRQTSERYWFIWLFITASFDTLGSYNCEATSIDTTQCLSDIKTYTKSYATDWDQSFSGFLEELKHISSE